MLKTNTAIVIKGGLAKGFGSIGLIRFLEENEIEPILVGSSAGAQITAMWGLGYKWNEIMEDTSSFQMSELSSASNFISQGYLFPDEKIYNFFLKRARNKDIKIEDLNRKIGFIATDKITLEPVLLHKGNLINSCLASNACPKVIREQIIDNRVLIDGDYSYSYSIDQIRAIFSPKKIIGIKSVENHKSLLKSLFSNILSYDSQNLELTKSAYLLDYEIQYDVSNFGYTSFKRIPELVDKVYSMLQRNKNFYLDLLTAQDASLLTKIKYYLKFK